MIRIYIVIHALELEYGLVKIDMPVLFIKFFFFPTYQLSILISFENRQMGRDYYGYVLMNS